MLILHRHFFSIEAANGLQIFVPSFEDAESDPEILSWVLRRARWWVDFVIAGFPFSQIAVRDRQKPSIAGGVLDLHARSPPVTRFCDS